LEVRDSRFEERDLATEAQRTRRIGIECGKLSGGELALPDFELD
jgi:hypothetical protein